MKFDQLLESVKLNIDDLTNVTSFMLESPTQPNKDEKENILKVIKILDDKNNSSRQELIELDLADIPIYLMYNKDVLARLLNINYQKYIPVAYSEGIKQRKILVKTIINATVKYIDRTESDNEVVPNYITNFPDYLHSSTRIANAILDKDPNNIIFIDNDKLINKPVYKKYVKAYISTGGDLSLFDDEVKEALETTVVDGLVKYINEVEPTYNQNDKIADYVGEIPKEIFNHNRIINALVKKDLNNIVLFDNEKLVKPEYRRVIKKYLDNGGDVANVDDEVLKVMQLSEDNANKKKSAKKSKKTIEKEKLKEEQDTTPEHKSEKVDKNVYLNKYLTLVTREDMRVSNYLELPNDVQVVPKILNKFLEVDFINRAELLNNVGIFNNDALKRVILGNMFKYINSNEGGYTNLLEKVKWLPKAKWGSAVAVQSYLSNLLNKPKEHLLDDAFKEPIIDFIGGDKSIARQFPTEVIKKFGLDQINTDNITEKLTGKEEKSKKHEALKL